MGGAMMVRDYATFLESKRTRMAPVGFHVSSLHHRLFPFQAAITRWALRIGRAAIFADTGLGKTAMQLEWARHIQLRTGGRVLILAPLCVAEQTAREGRMMDMDVSVRRTDPDAPGIYVSNYDIADHFDFTHFSGLVLDESSILKHIGARIRADLIARAVSIPYRLSCTATPAPNDYMEFGGQSEFLGVMRTAEMLAMFFTHDSGNTSQWRLKGHARKPFWEWLSNWAAYVRMPSDIGYSDDGYVLPSPKITHHITATDAVTNGCLFPMEATSLSERIVARRNTVDDRVRRCADIIGSDNTQWIVWCHLNTESRALTAIIPGAQAIEGSDDSAIKTRRLLGFADGSIRVLVTKPSIAGFGLNWQHCSNMAFVGLSDSYEQYYQALRRCWRFGQTKQVDVHIITADIEGAVLANLQRKEYQSQAVVDELRGHMSDFTKRALIESTPAADVVHASSQSGNGWILYNADCIDVAQAMASDSIAYSIFSPPFASLYAYSDSERDMGNCVNDKTFVEHFAFLIRELYRITMSGRLVSFHCMNLPRFKQTHGIIGLHDFRGELIRMFEVAGFIYHSEVCIWKDPVTAMQRTKALGLLHKTIRKDSSMARMGLPDYVVTMRKPGPNATPISHDSHDFPVSLWQRIASPIWMDINQGRTLNRDGAREDNDEKHIAPLQLDVIERCLMLWSAVGDLVFSPFAGIGSEGYVALQMNRRFVGVELKTSYFQQAVRNLSGVVRQTDLFAVAEGVRSEDASEAE